MQRFLGILSILFEGKCYNYLSCEQQENKNVFEASKHLRLPPIRSQKMVMKKNDRSAAPPLMQHHRVLRNYLVPFPYLESVKAVCQPGAVDVHHYISAPGDRPDSSPVDLSAAQVKNGNRTGAR
jgi:hypothetical protein